jgi:hypothetical protein
MRDSTTGIAPIPAKPFQRLKLFFPRCANVGDESWIGSTVALIVAAALAQAEISVHRPAHNIRIAVILPVILPPADLA